jgi:hypothetical protein
MKKYSVSPGDTIYVTEEFLRQGIIKAKVVSISGSKTWDGIFWSLDGTSESIKGASHKDFFLTYDEAVQRALQLIANKRKSISNKLQELDKTEQELRDYLSRQK